MNHRFPLLALVTLLSACAGTPHPAEALAERAALDAQVTEAQAQAVQARQAAVESQATLTSRTFLKKPLPMPR
jgi:hypothetical protein